MFLVASIKFKKTPRRSLRREIKRNQRPPITPKNYFPASFILLASNSIVFNKILGLLLVFSNFNLASPRALLLFDNSTPFAYLSCQQKILNMGGCSSTPAAASTKEINDFLRRDAKRQKEQCKLLLLGANLLYAAHIYIFVLIFGSARTW